MSRRFAFDFNGSGFHPLHSTAFEIKRENKEHKLVPIFLQLCLRNCRPALYSCMYLLEGWWMYLQMQVHCKFVHQFLVLSVNSGFIFLFSGGSMCHLSDKHDPYLLLAEDIIFLSLM